MPLPSISLERLNAGLDHALLTDACETWGFFQLVDHGLPDEALTETLDAMATFFALPAARKRAIERTKDNPWGFYDRELTKNVKDHKEIFDVGPENGVQIPQWPEGEDLFKARISAFYASAEVIALRVVAHIARTLDSPPETLLASFEGHTSYLRLNYYPLCDDPAPASSPTVPIRGELGISHHSDAGAVTVLLQDGKPGLQVEHQGRWVSVEAPRGALIVNIGDVVQVWSNDRYQAPLHRVLASDTFRRFSAPYFLNPSFETNYAPLEATCREQPARYRPINWGAFRAGRAAGDYANYGEEIQIAQFRI